MNLVKLTVLKQDLSVFLKAQGNLLRNLQEHLNNLFDQINKYGQHYKINKSEKSLHPRPGIFVVKINHFRLF